MKAIKTAALAIATVGLMFASGCDRHDKKEVFYLISVNSTIPYWQTLASGFDKAAAEYKVTAKVAGPDNYDPQAELAELQKAVAAKPAGILIQAADAAILKPGIDGAISAGIPVITVDSDAESSRRLYFIGTNNLEAGRLGGQHIAQKLGGKGNVVFFTFLGQPNIDDRLQGFKDALSAHPGIKIVEVVDVKADRNAAFDRTQQFMALTGAQKVDVFVSLEATSGKIIADAVKRANGSDRVVMAWDVSQDTLDEIKSGSIEATIAQKPFTMGYVGLKALDEVYHNPPAQLAKDNSADSFSHYPEFVDTGTSLVDKSNVDAYIAAAAGK
jgi:ribose transport system substrate-binding protein